MATLYQRGKVWWIDYRVGGKRIQRSLKTTRKRIAEEALKAIEGDLVRGKLGIAQRDLPLSTAIERFVAFQKATGGREGRGVSPLWARRQEIVLGRFAEHAAVSRLGHVNPMHLESYLAKRGPKTKGAGLAREWAVLRTFLRWAYRNRYLPEDLSARIKGPGEPARREIEYLSREDADKLLAALQAPAIGANGAKLKRTTPLYEMACVALYAGLRLGEIANLRRMDLDLAGRVLHVRVQDGWRPKDREGRAIPMPSPLVEVLAAWLKTAGKAKPEALLFASEAGKTYDLHNLYRRLTRVATNAGLRCHWYTLRHTYGSWLAQAGTSLHMIARFMGHSSVTTTERHYAGLQPEALHDFVEVLAPKTSSE